MAKVKLSGLLSGISGSVGGATFATGSNGLYVRNRSISANRNTQAQLNQRLNMATYSGQWRGLTDSDRLSWSQSASLFPYTDVFGDKKTYTGFQLYMKTNMILETAALDT